MMFLKCILWCKNSIKFWFTNEQNFWNELIYSTRSPVDNVRWTNKDAAFDAILLLLELAAVSLIDFSIFWSAGATAWFCGAASWTTRRRNPELQAHGKTL